MKCRPFVFGRLLLPAAALISFSGSAQAANLWDGGGGNANWTTAGNWDDNNTATSGSGNDVSFAGTSGLSSINDYSGFTAWRNVLFNSGAGSFNLTSASGANWDLHGKIENNSINAQSITIDAIALQSASANEFDATAGNLTITAKDIYNNGNSLTFWGAKTLVVNNGGGSGISGIGKVILGSAFTGTAVLTGSNSYSGNTEINSGTLKVGHSSGLGTSTVFVGNGGATGTAATLLLTGSGLSVSNNLNTNAGTNSNRMIGGDNTSGTNTFTGTLAMASGGSATLTAADGGTVAFTGVISGTGQGITKRGLGTVTLNGAAVNTYTGATAVSSGTLKLDFSNLATPTNLINSGSALQMAGGTLQLVGKDGVATSQAFASTTFAPGSSVISAAPASGATLPSLALGALTFNLGGTVRFDGAATIGAANVAVAATSTITTTTAGIGSFGVVLGGANPFSGAPATVGLYDWASTSLAGGGAGTSPYTIMGGSQVTGFYQTTFGGNFNLTTNSFNTPTGNPFANTVRFNTSTATTLVNRGILLVGGFLITPNMGANNAQVTQGASAGDWQINRVTSPTGNQEGVIWQNNTLGYFTLNQNIANGRDAGDNNFIVKAGDGTAVFAGTGDSGYVGQTYVNGGNLVIAKNSHLGALTTGAAVNLNGGTLFGNATFTLSNAGANKRPVTLLGNGGGLAASAGNTMTVDGVVSGAVGTGALVIGIPASSANGNVAGLLPGSGAGTANTTAVYASGTVALTGSNSYTGGTIAKSGTVQINGINALGGANYGGLTLDNATLKYATAFTGNGSGDLTSIGAAGITLASGGGTIDTNGNSVTYAGSIGNGGTGGLTKAGAGTLTLNGANYAGGTTVNGGTLVANGFVPGATAVNIGGTLGGTATYSGTITVGTGGIIAPGNSVGTITTGGLTLGSGSILNFEFNTTPANDYINVTNSGGLTINGGGFNLYAEGTVNPFSTVGTYNLIGYSGAIGGTGTSSLSVLNPLAGKTYGFGATGSNVTLDIAVAGVVSDWNVDADGSWNTGGNWTSVVPNGAGETANFTKPLTAARTVTLDGAKTVGNMVFSSGTSPLGYTIAQGSSGTLALDNGANQVSLIVSSGDNTISSDVSIDSTIAVAAVNTGASLTVSGSIGGVGGLVKSGAGLLDLTNGANGYDGNTSLAGGTLGFSALGSLGDGNFSFEGGTLRYNAGNTADISTKTITLASGGGTFNTNGNNVILANAIGNFGTGGLTKVGAGSLTLGGTNTQTGATIITEGTLAISSNSNLGDAVTGASLTLNGGTLTTSATLALDNAGANFRNVIIGASGGTVSTDLATTLTVGGTVSGSAALTKLGAGTLTLTANNSAGFSGAVNLNAGMIQLGGAQANGQQALGTGAVTFNGGTLLLNGAGATDNGTSYGSLNNALNVPLGQTGTISVPKRITMGSTLTGAGTLNVGVDGTNQNYQGNWSAFTGQINLTGAGEFRIANFQNQVFNNAKLNIGAGVHVYQTFNPPTGSGTQTVQAIGELSGAAGSLLGGQPVGGRFVNWTVGSLNTTSTFSGTIQNGVGEARLTKVGTGTLVLDGANTYTGATSVNGGTLVINGDQSAATGLLTVAAGTTNATAVRLKGSGTVGGNTSFTADPDAGGTQVGGIHSPGNSVGKQTFDATGAATTNLTYNSGSIFEWELGATPATTDITKDGGDPNLVTGSNRGVAYDAVNVSGTLGGSGAIFRVVLGGAQDFSESFWTQQREWTDIFRAADHVTGQVETASLDIASIFTGGFQYYNYSGAGSTLAELSTPSAYGSFTITGSTLTWTAVPEPTSALAGLLVAAGLLRRRRA